METETNLQTEALNAMRELGCDMGQTRSNNGRSGGGTFCRTHSEGAWFGDGVHGVCKRAFNAARGSCGHVLCERRDEGCLLDTGE